jgi:PAS domain S-box-containing protein
MDSLSQDATTLAVRLGLPFVASGPNFEILYCNVAFEELLEYSSFELKKRKWDAISVQNEDLETDKEMTAELITGTRQTMTVIKSYVSKRGIPIPGQLTAIRYPQGESKFEFALCFFVPLANGSKAALNLVVDYIERHTNASHAMAEKIATMSQDLQTRKSLTVGERLWDTFGEWALQNPKFAVVVFLILLSLNPFPFVVTWFTRMGWLPPQPVQIEVQDKFGNNKQATKSDLVKLGVVADVQKIQNMAPQAANKIGFVVAEKGYSVTTKTGRTVSWSRGGRPLSIGDRRDQWNDNSDFRSY